MNTLTHPIKLLTTAIAMTLVLGACTTGPTKPQGANEVRSKLTALQSNPQLANLAPVAIKDAEEAVRVAEEPRKDLVLAKHLVTVADRKVEIASHQAQARFIEDQRASLGQQADTARLDSRTREADRARDDANAARQENERLRQEITDLNAKETERGLVVTLGDLLFETGKSELKGGAANNLAKLATFLNRYEDRTISVEGHTDNVGSDDSNFNLSQRRADSVKSYLLGQGIAAGRITVSGMGEGSPVASNDSASGRQMNRRVEVIIANLSASM
jgi:outer membrane protein OmpA-like peptidoglycan-associated protein